jgi:probable HAF family extracellular repeat protein
LEDRVVPSTGNLAAPPVLTVSPPAPQAASANAAHQDYLYVSDGSDNTVKQFNATTGAFVGDLVTSRSQGLDFPTGLIFQNPGQLLVSDGIDDSSPQAVPGPILKYNGKTGVPLGALVPATDPNVPWSPRGLVVGPGPGAGPNGTLYVGDMGSVGDGSGHLGRLERYDSHSGAFLGDLQPTGFTGVNFDPRGVVIGPDGLLYAGVRNDSPLGGEVMRWDPNTGQGLGNFVVSDSTNDLQRPEGLVFGPDGNLYVTSFRANASDNDKILIFAGPQSTNPGTYLGKIDLDQAGQPRSYAQDILFGPDGKLFVPITGNGPDTGSVRRYDVSTGTFDVFVPPTEEPSPSFLYCTFGNTDPSTLDYLTPPGEGPLSTSAAAPSATARTAGGTLQAAPSAGSRVAPALLPGALAANTSSPSGGYDFTTIDFPNAPSTQALGINASGQIVGGYLPGGPTFHGFLLSGGQYTTLDDPNGVGATTATGINASGQIVGGYVDANGVQHGFLLTGGQYTTLDDPNAVFGTGASGINASGEVVGFYVDANFGVHGFLLSGGQYTTLDDPNGILTEARGINASGQIVGVYVDANFGDHGFLLSGGQYTTLDDPNVGTSFPMTEAHGINDRGQIVGDYVDATGAVVHGFLLSGGQYTTLDEPNTPFFTDALGINPSGKIVGNYYDANFVGHGFLATPAHGNSAVAFGPAGMNSTEKAPGRSVPARIPPNPLSPAGMLSEPLAGSAGSGFSPAPISVGLPAGAFAAAQVLAAPAATPSGTAASADTAGPQALSPFGPFVMGLSSNNPAAARPDTAALDAAFLQLARGNPAPAFEPLVADEASGRAS